jgi:mono/diheme cytochrome c family protein
MKSMLMLFAMLTLGVLALLVGTPQARAQDLVERGRYLTIVADCEACHTDPSQPQLRFAGGRMIQTPFGTLAAPNITPDRATGIGAWTDGDFDAAVRYGVRADRSRLYPAMPYVYYRLMSADEVRAIRAYLQTLPAIHHVVPPQRLAFPLSIRALMRIWDALYFTPDEFKPDASQPAQWNRGAYLVQGPGHCGACHTPKNLLGADKKNMALYGYTTQGWFSPDLTADPQRGLNDWSAQDITQYLKSGHNRYAAASGPMAEEVSLSSSQISADDLEAIARYLKTQQGHTQPVRPVERTEPLMVAGGAIYQDLCSACHASNGHGVPYLIPDIAASDSVASREPSTVLRVVLQGAPSVATAQEPTGPAMPGFGRRLNDSQIAAVTTYIRNSFGHGASPINEAQVAKMREALHAGAAQ